jgi:hypothetical protein
MKNQLLETTLNYNRITSKGRCLILYVWGIDPFFTFLPDERNDGFGDACAYGLIGKVTYARSKAKSLPAHNC